MSRGVIDQSMNYLAEVHSTYGTLRDMSANITCAASATKIALQNFSGNGCSKSSNGIKVNKAGVYEISATIYMGQNYQSNDIVHVLLYVNSTAVAHFQEKTFNTAMWSTFSTDRVIVNLSANDVVYLYAYNQGGAMSQLATSNTSTTSLTLNRIA